MKSKIIIPIFFFLLIPIITALPECLESEGCIGSFPTNSNVTIYQICNNCTYCNFSDVRNDHNNIILRNVAAIQNDTQFNYIIHYGNFSRTEISKYQYDYVCGNDIDKESGTLWFIVSPSGKTLGTGESIVYVFLTVVLFGLISMFFYFILVMPKDNEQNSRGEYTKIVKMKYLRILFIAILYPLIIVLLNLMNGLAINFATLSIFSGIIGFLFEVMLRGAWVFTVVILLWVIYKGIQDTNVKKAINNLGRFKLYEE